jgi:6-phosphogluconolactonase
VSGFEAFPDREELFEAAAGRVAGELRAALAARGRASLAVPGGTTPGPFLQRLSAERLDWALVTVMPTDERCVNAGSPRLNEGLIRAALLQDAAAAAGFVSLATGPDRPEHAAGRLAQTVEPFLPLDVCVLGMGEDLHTASLFPGADRLAVALSADAPPVMVLRAPGAPEARVSLTAPVLRAARSVIVLIAGAAKQAALARARLDGPEIEAPIRVVLDRAQVLYAP